MVSEGTHKLLVRRVASVSAMIVAVLALLGCLWASSMLVSEVIDWVRPRPLHPTYEELRRHGFYVLVLPEKESRERGWRQDVSIWSWDIHCGVLSGDTYNPLRVTYEDGSGSCVFEIQLGYWPMAWDHRQVKERTEFSVDSRLNSSGTVTYYTRAGESNLVRNLYHFSDMKGIGVDIVSSLPVTETIELIEDLDYVGPPLETLNNPWDCKHLPRPGNALYPLR